VHIWSWKENLSESIRNKLSRKAGGAVLSAQITDIAEEAILYFSADDNKQYANPAASLLLADTCTQNLTVFTQFLQENAENFSRETDADKNNKITSFSAMLETNGRFSRVRAMRMDDGGMAVIANDITASRKVRESTDAVLQEKQKMEQALEAMGSGVAMCCIVDGKSQIVFANKVFQEIVAPTENNIVSDVDLPDLLQKSVGADATALRTAIESKDALNLEWCYEREDNAPCWYRVALSPLASAQEKAGCYVCFLNDITESRVQKAQLFQSQKLEALGQLAGGVAHDFNNLLSIVDGYTRMAIKHIDEDDPAFNYLERIKQANRRGAALTKQLLTFGRHKIISESVVDVGALLTEQEPLLRPLLNASIDLSIRGGSGVYVDCAADGVAQILMNLVINARDSMLEGGMITISADIVDWVDLPLSLSMDRTKKDKYACLRIEDTGTGMSHETQARIFDPFFTTKEQGKGTGLGLSMVYGIVGQSGGGIDVKSTVDVGTTMNLYFPLSDKTPEVKRIIKAEEGGSPRFEGYTALVAEDEPDLLFVIGNMLEDMGMTVIKAEDGNDALMKQDDYDGGIDFMLTDVVMPELNGARLAEMMTELRPETKIVFMSGYPASGAQARVPLPEEAWLLAKPVEFEKLAGVLAARLQDDEKAKMESTRGMYRWQA